MHLLAGWMSWAVEHHATEQMVARACAAMQGAAAVHGSVLQGRQAGVH